MNTARSNLQPAIARVWRGRTTAARADEYAGYLYEHGIKPLKEKALGVQMFREDRADESEFVTISYWESVAAMSRFAGDDPRRIHHLARCRVSHRAAAQRAGSRDRRNQWLDGSQRAAVMQRGMREGIAWDRCAGLQDGKTTAAQMLPSC